jgi:hypothetical protein
LEINLKLRIRFVDPKAKKKPKEFSLGKKNEKVINKAGLENIILQACLVYIETNCLSGLAYNASLNLQAIFIP